LRRFEALHGSIAHAQLDHSVVHVHACRFAVFHDHVERRAPDLDFAVGQHHKEPLAVHLAAYA
jgi:hypothetical protein